MTVANYVKKESNPKNAGRNTKLTPELMESIENAVTLGCYVEAAAAMNGISKQTFYNWMRIGARVTTKSPKSELIYAEFVDRMRIALATAEARDLKMIDDAARAGAWQAAAWKMERRNPKYWSKQRLDSNADMYSQLNVDGDLEDPVIDALKNITGAITGGDNYENS